MALNLDSLRLSSNLPQVGLSKVTQPAAKNGPSQVNFGEALDNALKTVSRAQANSSAMQKSVQLGQEGVSIEQTMIAMQKSSIGFTAAVTVRNKMVAAYSEIMSMQV